MRTIRLGLKKCPYDIIVGNNIISGIGKLILRLKTGCDAYIITNPLIRNRYGKILSKALEKEDFTVRFKALPDTERSKSVTGLTAVIADLARYDKKKQVLIIAFGGGVVGDLAGFVASIYKRGIPYIQIPTTLLAQVDSSIGGKTAIDLSEGKNLLGAFYQPKLVLSDVHFLKTLDLRQLRSGLAEVVKYGVIKDARLFSCLENNHKAILSFNSAALEHIVSECSRIKAAVVQQDEREEKGIRTILNFGHTVGHAIEAASSYKGYNHGEAVALGMLVACDISSALKLVDDKSTGRIERLIKLIGLPTRIKGVSLKKIVSAHYRDKKFIGSKNRLVLLEGIGKTKIVENIPLKVIREAICGRLY